MLTGVLGADDSFIGFDRDGENLERAREYLEQTPLAPQCHYIHSSFALLTEKLSGIGVGSIDFILYDLGVSSVHYDRADRGFSFRFDGPLDMRFDRSQ